MTTTATPAAGATAAAGGPRLLVVVHEDRAGLGRLAPGLERRFGPGALDERRPDLGDPLPADTAGFDALIVLGGSMAAWEDDVAGWLPATRALLVDAIGRDVPALGICLGAQLLAHATGGTVERGPQGLEVGLVTVDLLPAAADDPLLGAVRADLGPAVTVPQWHNDAVTALPPDAVLLASGERYPHQAFRVGSAWGVQYHPEVSADDWAAWNQGGAAAVRAAGLTPEDLDAQAGAAQDHLHRVAEVHAAAFADVVAARRAATG